MEEVLVLTIPETLAALTLAAAVVVAAEPFMEHLIMEALAAQELF